VHLRQDRVGRLIWVESAPFVTTYSLPQFFRKSLARTAGRYYPDDFPSTGLNALCMVVMKLIQLVRAALPC
jgi:hypothetical protein